MNKTSPEPGVQKIADPGQRVVVITGASSGIGRATALALAKRGRHVVAVVRDPAGAPTTAGRQDRGAITPIRADLSRPQEVAGAAQEILARFGHVDVLINNAATVPRERRETPEGFEVQLVVNHLATVLLTHKLLPTMDNGRVIVVSSALHADPAGILNFDDLGGRGDYNTGKIGGWTQYCRTKRMNLLFTLRLSRLTDPAQATVNALHPGAVSTRLSRELPALTRLVAKLFFSSPKKGAQTPVYLADSPEVAGSTGGYYVDCRPARAAMEVYDIGRQDRLHEATMALLVPWL